MSGSIRKLSELFSLNKVLVDAEFTCLDDVLTSFAGALVFCQTYEYLGMANKNPNVVAVITTASLAKEVQGKGVVIADNPRLDFFKLYCRLNSSSSLRPQMDFGRGENCKIHPSATISALSSIGNNVVIGANVVIEDFVSVGDGTQIGPQAVIGAEGMMTVIQEDGSPLIVPHAGGVNIGKNVIILSGAVIAKSLYRRFTEIGDFCQIGILSNIGHGAVLGKSCIISGNSVVSGRTELGDHVWMGVNSSIAQGLKVGAYAQIKMGSVVVRNIEEKEVVSGNFALPHKKNVKHYLELYQ